MFQNGKLKIIDFGFAREIPDDGLDFQYGTLGYVAPEAIEGRAYLQSDIFSLGIVLFIMIFCRESTVYWGNMFQGFGDFKQRVRDKLSYVKEEGQLKWRLAVRNHPELDMYKEFYETLDNYLGPRKKRRLMSIKEMV